MKKIRLFIADDHAILRDGIITVFKTEPTFNIIGEASNGQEALTQILEKKPDLAILDINMPKMNGLEVARNIKQSIPAIKVLLLTMHDEIDFIDEAVSIGVDGYIFKFAEMDELINAVNTIATGQHYFQAEVSQLLLTHKLKQAGTKSEDLRHRFDNLSKRELEIIKLIASGLTSNEISERLYISYFTVSKHRKNILKKVQLKTMAEVINHAIKYKLL